MIAPLTVRFPSRPSGSSVASLKKVSSDCRSFTSNLLDSIWGSGYCAPLLRDGDSVKHRFKTATHTFFQKVVYGCFLLTFWTPAARRYCVVVPQSSNSTAAAEIVIGVLPVWDASGRVSLIDSARLPVAAAAVTLSSVCRMGVKREVTETGAWPRTKTLAFRHCHPLGRTPASHPELDPQFALSRGVDKKNLTQVSYFRSPKCSTICCTTISQMQIFSPYIAVSLTVNWWNWE